MQHIVIIGATSAMAEHCARLWLQEAPHHLTLVGRDEARCQRVAQDLRARNAQARVDIELCDFLDAQAIQACITRITTQAPVNQVLIAHGTLPEQASCQAELTTCQQALALNGLSPALFAEAFAGHFALRGQGTLALIGSVAGDRGRQSNYVYGAAKGLVTRYAQGLQHRFANTAIKVVLIKPGPTDTPMTAALKSQGARLAPVTQVAAEIVKAMQNGQPTLYTPGKWRLIMWVIRHLPSVIFNRLKI